MRESRKGSILDVDAVYMAGQFSHLSNLRKRLMKYIFLFMTVSLDRDVEEFLQKQVRRGVCADANELVNDVIRSIRDQQQKPFEVTPELESWLLEAADKPATSLTKNDFGSIRERIRTRHKL